jgi:hypothetical protein
LRSVAPTLSSCAEATKSCFIPGITLAGMTMIFV